MFVSGIAFWQSCHSYRIVVVVFFLSFFLTATENTKQKQNRQTKDKHPQQTKHSNCKTLSYFVWLYLRSIQTNKSICRFVSPE